MTVNGKCRPTMRGMGPTLCPSCDAVVVQGQHVLPDTGIYHYHRLLAAKEEVDWYMEQA
jgi:hypothetical protein